MATLPGAVSALERSVTARVRRVGEGLDTLTQQLRDIASIQKPTSKNPFSGRAPRRVEEWGGEGSGCVGVLRQSRVRVSTLLLTVPALLVLLKPCPALCSP